MRIKPIRPIVQIVRLCVTKAQPQNWLLLSVILLCSKVCFASELKVVADIWPPFVMVENEQARGIGVDILNEIVSRTGDTINIVVLPNLRARKVFEEGMADIFLLDSLLWNPVEKRKLMIFTDEIMRIQEYIYSLKSSHLKVNKPSDLNGKSVNIMRGYYYETFAEAFDSNMIQPHLFNDAKQMIHLLERKRSDAIFMDSINFNYLIDQLGYSKELFEKGLLLSDYSLAVKVHIKKSEILARFNKAITDMKKEGLIEKIIKKYSNQ